MSVTFIDGIRFVAPPTGHLMIGWGTSVSPADPGGIIHVRRPDARDIDCILHVNPKLEPKGLAMVFTPLDQPVTRSLKLNLYCTGLTDEARIRERETESRVYEMSREYEVEIPIRMEPRSVTWLVIDEP